MPFYGTAPAGTDVAAIACPVLAFYGSADESLMGSLPQVTESMRAGEVDFDPVVYEGRRHAFFNDTNRITYEPEAAADAWARLLAFLDEHLR